MCLCVEQHEHDKNNNEMNSERLNIVAAIITIDEVFFTFEDFIVNTVEML